MAKKIVEKESVNEGNEMLKLIKLVVLVSVIFGLFYLLTVLINKEEEETPEVDNPAQIQYDEILVGNLLEQPNDEYYVLVYDTEDKSANAYLAYLSNYKYMTDSLRYYTAKLNNPLNTSFISEESNFKIKEITDLKLTGTTLFKIKKGKISKYYEGEKITEILQELTKEEEKEAE